MRLIAPKAALVAGLDVLLPGKAMAYPILPYWPQPSPFALTIKRRKARTGHA